MKWLALESLEEPDGRLGMLGGFHESSLHEAHVWTETWTGAQFRYRPGDEAAQTECI